MLGDKVRLAAGRRADHDDHLGRLRLGQFDRQQRLLVDEHLLAAAVVDGRLRIEAGQDEAGRRRLTEEELLRRFERHAQIARKQSVGAGEVLLRVAPGSAASRIADEDRLPPVDGDAAVVLLLKQREHGRVRLAVVVRPSTHEHLRSIRISRTVTLTCTGLRILPQIDSTFRLNPSRGTFPVLMPF